MVAGVGPLHLDVGQPGLLQQMLGEFTAGAGKILALGAVTPHLRLHPPLRAEDEGDERGDAEENEKGHDTS